MDVVGPISAIVGTLDWPRLQTQKDVPCDPDVRGPYLSLRLGDRALQPHLPRQIQLETLSIEQPISIPAVLSRKELAVLEGIRRLCGIEDRLTDGVACHERVVS